MIYAQFQKNINSLINNIEFPTKSIALAVSGGSDSLALLMLAHRWATDHQFSLVVMSVDHHLREKSKVENDYVCTLSEQLKCKHYLLHFDHQNNFSNLQARAREARYQFMTDLCIKLDILTLLTAHHLDDYIENYYMSLEKKSSLFGLSQCNINWFNNVRIARPLFNIPKRQLVEYLVKKDVKWFEDESNLSDKYRRNVIRKTLTMVDDDSKNQIILQISAINQIVEEILKPEFIACTAESVKIYEFGFATINLLKFAEFASEIQLQTLSFVLIMISGKNRGSRSESLNLIMNLLQQKKNFIKTLHGCMVKKIQDNLIIHREFGRKVPVNILLDDNKLKWDDRFLFSIPNILYHTIDSNGLHVRDEKKIVDFSEKAPNHNESKSRAMPYITNLTVEDYSKIKQYLDLKILKKLSQNNHIAILFTLPTVKILEKVIAIPHISYYDREYLNGDLYISFSPNFISRFTHFC